MSEMSFLEYYEPATGRRETLQMYSRIIEAPLWVDDDTLLYSSLGRLWLYSISQERETMLDTGACRGCVNDYVLSRDRKTLYFNNVPLAPVDWSSFLHTMPLDGSEPPRMVTPHSPTYVHSVSSRGDIYFSGTRKVFQAELDIYVLPPQGEEKRLTDGRGYNDGPEITPDDSQVWFCSNRGGDGMQLWVMNPDGTDMRQITHAEHDCWYPHFSPDGSTVSYFAAPRQERPNPSALIHVQAGVRAISPDGADDHELLSLAGGQCTINSTSWSPDSRRFAFVTYR